MAELNPSQARHVSATFSHVDSLLESVAAASQASASPFSAVQPDLSADEVRLLESYIAMARARMLAALDRLGIPRLRPTVAARWSALTALAYADTSLAELDPETLRGYGSVDPAVSAEVGALADDLRELVRRASEALREDEPNGLADRLGQVLGPVGEVLRELARITAERGLAEVRPLIAAAAERALSTTFDVGVFGRVSAGKSSLINALVGTGALPVGATPVTAVPIRIRKGPAGALVRYPRDDPRPIALGEVAAYATEESNPQNRLGVLEIDISVPTVLDGLLFLDTPGIGSLATSGPAQSFAWLPRCDLGLVLIAAGGAVTRDDLALISGFAHAGIDCRVLLSKSDLLRDAELAASLAYTRAELRAALGPDAAPAVTPVSTVTNLAVHLQAIRRDILEPLAANRARSARDALAARLLALIAACEAALAGRAGSSQDRRIALAKTRAQAAARVREESRHLRGLAPVALDVAAQAAARVWVEGGEAGGAVRHVLLEAAGGALEAVRRATDEARAAPVDDGADGRRMPPLFDPPLLDALPLMRRPRLAPRPLLRTIALRRLRVIERDLDQALNTYASRLEVWGLGLLDEMTTDMWLSPEPGPEERPELAHLRRAIENWRLPESGLGGIGTGGGV